MIPKSIGAGNWKWEWGKTSKSWFSKCFAHATVLPAEETGGVGIAYFFSQKPTLDGSPMNPPNYLTPAAMRGFLKLIEINPNLEPPTEE